MKLLLFDRGLIDGATVSRLKALGVDSRGGSRTAPTPQARDGPLDRRPGPRRTRPGALGAPRPPQAPGPSAPARPPRARRAPRGRPPKDPRTEAPGSRPQAPRAHPRVHRIQIEYKWIEPSRVWETCTVPVNVLLVRNHYADGETLDWALASTRVFADPLEMWTTYRLRPAIEEDHRQEKCFWDMTRFRSPAFSLVVNQVLFVELAYSLIQIFLRQIERGDLLGRSRQRLLDALLPTENKIVLYYRQRFGFFTPYEHQELLLTLRDGARRKLLGKTRRLRRAQLAPPDLPWRTP